jgi:mRNA interferase RelE/StbE
MAYTIEFSRSADREFRKLPLQIQSRLRPRIESLSLNPRPTDAKKLAGKEYAWRIRVGDYRVVYEVHDRILYVLLVRVAHRREVYR